jgi:hypothetical protein
MHTTTTKEEPLTYVKIAAFGAAKAVLYIVGIILAIANHLASSSVMMKNDDSCAIMAVVFAMLIGIPTASFQMKFEEYQKRYGNWLEGLGILGRLVSILFIGIVDIGFILLILLSPLH